MRIVTDSVLPDVLQNKFQAGNGSVPSPAYDRFIFFDIHGCQIQHFQKAIIRWKNSFVFGDFPELTVESFNGIFGINQASYCLWIFEISGQGCPVIIPEFIDFRLLGITFIFKQFQFI